MTKQQEKGNSPQFANEIEEARYQIGASAGWLTNNLRNHLKPYGITWKQYNILSILRNSDYDAMRIQEVRDSMTDKMSDASRLIDRLVQKKLIKKTPSTVDGRSNLAELTPAGYRMLERIEKDSERLDGIIGDQLSKKEVKQLNELLSKMRS